MRALRLGALWLIVGSLTPATVSAQITEATFRKTVEANARFRDGQLAAYGLMPAATVAAEGRSVRRFRVGIFVPIALPAVELERRADATVVTRLHFARGRVEESATPPGIWEALAKLDAALYAAPSFARERERLAKPVTWSSCHGDDATFQLIERGGVRHAGGKQCANSITVINDIQVAAMRLFARAALDAAGCPPAGEGYPVRAMEDCFRGRRP